MHFPRSLRLACFIAMTGAVFHAHAESFASSASSAGSASSGSVSDSLNGSSNSSKTDDDKKADGDYRITDVAEAPNRAGFRRITMQADGIPADNVQQRIVLDLPAAVLDKQGLGRGDLVRAQHRVYGFEFARTDTREAFYLVLADKWHAELTPRVVVGL